MSSRQQRADMKKGILENIAAKKAMLVTYPMAPLSSCKVPEEDGTVFRIICPDDGYILKPIIYTDGLYENDDISMVASIIRPDRTMISIPVDKNNKEKFEDSEIPVMRGDRIEIKAVYADDETERKEVYVGFLYECHTTRQR